MSLPQETLPCMAFAKMALCVQVNNGESGAFFQSASIGPISQEEFSSAEPGLGSNHL